jgi:hypothetical protein
MLSGTRPILVHVRNSFDALRLCALVAAGATSGYLWRAALESSAPQVRLSETPPAVHAPPPAPAIQIPPQILSPKGPRSARNVTRGGPTGGLTQRFVPAVATVPPRVVVPPPPTAAPPPSPTPQTPPPPSPPPAPPPPQATTPPPPPTPPPPIQAASAPPPPPPPSAPADDGQRPGWGKGDKNHDHTGPGEQGH